MGIFSPRKTITVIFKVYMKDSSVAQEVVKRVSENEVRNNDVAWRAARMATHGFSYKNRFDENVYIPSHKIEKIVWSDVSS